MRDLKEEQLMNQIFKPHALSQEDEAKSVTIMKYLGDDDDYHFVVLDKFNISDEVERLDYMNYLKDTMLKSGKMKKHLWTKTTILF